ncbi:phosphate ABC transporter permease subunit PstC [Lacibacterium aquatile]|uniref:Phosphate transport system permease protein n=1 Tax=Lacibacterium aquatile TaxID=1168082 RepID=A0ABW5DWE9_9PROT
MSPSVVFLTLAILATVGFWMGRRRAVGLAPERGALHSLPGYYGYYVAVWCGVPALLLACLWLIAQGPIVRLLVEGGHPALFAGSPSELSLVWSDLFNLVSGIKAQATASPDLIAAAAHYSSLNSLSHAALAVVALALAVAGLAYARSRISPKMRARNAVERFLMVALLACSIVAVLTTLGIVLSLLFEALRFFGKYPVLAFLFGTEWSPQTAIRADQVGSSGAFGFLPLLYGTMMITVIAMIIAVPVGLMSAIYMADYATPRIRAVAKPALEVLAGIPSVVYGFFAALTVAPAIRNVGVFFKDPVVSIDWTQTLFGIFSAFGTLTFRLPFSFDLDIAGESALAAGLVMGIMIVPYISSLADDVIHAVPQSLRHGAYGLGSTKSETIRQVVLPAALPGIVAAVMLAVSRAIGETMIVAMAAGLAAGDFDFNPLKAVTTITVQIATLLVGDQEFDSPKTLSVFALGLVLFCVTLTLNFIALRVVRKYREKYD